MKAHVQVLRMLKLNKSDPDFSLMRPVDEKTSGVSSHDYHGQASHGAVGSQRSDAIHYKASDALETCGSPNKPLAF